MPSLSNDSGFPSGTTKATTGSECDASRNGSKNASNDNESEGNSVSCIATQKLVSGDYGEPSQKTPTPTPTTTTTIHPVLCSDVALSFWGGIDELTGIVIDASHPLCGQDVSNTILVLPSGRGSCTASQVLLELILNRKSPRALVLRDRDGLVCVGALVARCVLPDDDKDDKNGQVPILDVLQVMDSTKEDGNDSTIRGDSCAASESESTMFDALIEYQPKYGSVLPCGKLVVGKTEKEVQQKLDLLSRDPATNQEEESSTTQYNNLGDEFEFEFELSTEERRMLEESSTDAERRAVEVLIRYAHIVATPPSSLSSSSSPPSPGASPTYIDVKRAHIDGCTYIGPGGLKFVEKLVEDGGRVKIPTTLNSVSTDLRYWEPLGIRDDVTNRNSIRQAEAYVALGCSSKSFTCAPYLLEDEESIGIPRKGDQIVWGESNAVVYANTVLGARTEKYADYLDICCAIAGKVPLIGVHLDDPRTPTVVLELDSDALDLRSADGRHQDKDDSFSLLFPVLGHLCGSLSDGEVPLLIGLEEYADLITRDHLKAFCAAFGTTAASPLIHIAGITPEACDSDIDAWIQLATRSKVIRAEHLQETFDALDQRQHVGENTGIEVDVGDNVDKVDWVALGNPHLSLSEIDELLRLVENQAASCKDTGSKKRDDVRVIACISRALYDQSINVKRLEDYGFTFVRDTCWCMLLDPPMIPSDPNATILTNSGKYAHYGPGLTDRNFRLGSMKDCVNAAWTGTLPRRSHTRDVPWGRIDRRSFSSKISDASGQRRNTSTLGNRFLFKHALKLFR